MTLTELRYIVAVARERHFGRAAESCFVSQPTLSVAVRKLETELGVTLFERNSGDISVTPIGEQVVEQAQRTLEQAETVKQTAAFGKDQLRGPLRLGAIYTIGPYVFPDLIPQVIESAPEMPLVIEENFTAALTIKLKQGQVDVILISLPYNEPGIVTLPLYEEPFVALLPAAHPLCAEDKIQRGMLKSENVLLLGAGHCFRDQVIEAYPECLPRDKTDNQIQTVTDGSSLETIRHMVVSGLGLTILPCTAAGADRYSQRLLSIKRFEAPEPGRVVALAWRKSFPRPKVIDILTRAIKDSHSGCTKILN